MINVKAQYGII